MPAPTSQTAAAPERIRKDDGRFYVARKPVTVEPLGAGDDFALVVLRTHDFDRYRERAVSVWDQYQDSPLPAPQQVWVRLVPWDPHGAYQYSYQWVESTDRGAVPALWFERP